ncbi:dihydrofolate reductase [Microbacterium phage Quenya]|uniref:dihydrofolate reductase n=1 Tax=Microbacterium phage Quenya TaxID=2776868 RepID=UPI0018A4A209|nr:dihydrofolate reductase [Microbacterium phage Quenya]QOP64293.1 dihydrofolate reductase [Microbacterium phage Quenya]
MTTDAVAVWAEALEPGGASSVMGADTPSGLPWPHSPRDLRRFAEVTAGRTLIMGRRTFDYLPVAMKRREALRERPMIVLTSDPRSLHMASPGLLIQGLDWVRTEADAAWLLRELAKPSTIWDSYAERPVAVIGGRAVIEQFAPHLDRLEVTRVHGRYVGDTPAPSDAVFDNFVPAGSVQTDGLTFHTYTRRNTK